MIKSCHKFEQVSQAKHKKISPLFFVQLGLEDWVVCSRNLEIYKTYEEVDEKWKTTICFQMFPPKLADRNKYNLKKW